MDKPAIDVRRTVPASSVVFDDENGYPDYFTPGAMEWRGWGFLLACPGCGSVSGINVGQQHSSPRWLIESGSVTDVTTLTLKPSLNCTGCCGWHGHLKNGVFSVR